MPNLVVTLNNNILKISHIGKDGFHKAETELPKEVCNDTEITEPKVFSDHLKGLLDQLFPKKPRGLSVTFVLEPNDVALNIVTLNKKAGILDEKIVAEEKKLLEGITLEELYFSYYKLAPFEYQFVGVRKSLIEKLIEVFSKLNIELKHCVSWPLILPKLVGSLEAVVFLVPRKETSVFVLSNLSGISLTKECKNAVVPKILDSLESDKLYVMPNDVLSLGSKYKHKIIEIPNMETKKAEGFEMHLLTHYMGDVKPDDMFDLLSLIPVPVVETKKLALAKVGKVLSVLLVIGGLIGGFAYLVNNKNIHQGEVAQAQDSVVQETPRQDLPKENVEEEEVKPAVGGEELPLDKVNLKIMIENGAGEAGLAGRTKDFLENLDYNVINVGDSEIVGRQNTLLKFKTSKIGYKETLRREMRENFLDIVVEDDLDPDLEYDLLIVVGTKTKGI